MNHDRAGSAPPSSGFSIAGRHIPWGAREVGFGALWFLTLFLLVPIPITLPFLSVYGEDAAETVGALLIGSYFSQMGLVAVAAFFTFRKYGGGWERLGWVPVEKRHVMWGVAGFGAAFAVIMGYGALVEIFDVQSLRSDCAEQVPDTVIGNPTLIALAAVLALAFAPICEETFFRGFVMPGLAKSWGVALGVLISAAFFTAGHSQPDDAMATVRILLAIFPIGIIFALVYLRSGSILSTVIAHFCFNIFGVIGIAACNR